jgi:hypothetical protein
MRGDRFDPEDFDGPIKDNLDALGMLDQNHSQHKLELELNTQAITGLVSGRHLRDLSVPEKMTLKQYMEKQKQLTLMLNANLATTKHVLTKNTLFQNKRSVLASNPASSIELLEALSMEKTSDEANDQLDDLAISLDDVIQRQPLNIQSTSSTSFSEEEENLLSSILPQTNVPTLPNLMKETIPKIPRVLLKS